jgi:ubiquinol-cytochrome c reductase iron-sulfur subunit
LLRSLSPSADVLELATGIEVQLSDIPEGEQIDIAYLPGRPVIVRHRTADEITEAEAVDLDALTDNTTRDVFGRDLGTADDRNRRATPDGKFIAVLGVEPHHGCHLLQGGDFVWIDPCVSTHFDISGRARRHGFAGNLLVPVSHLAAPDRLRLVTNPNYLRPTDIDDLLYR